jgi:hypothetical protein
LITEAANYDPVRAPLQTLTPKALRLPKQIVSDLLVVIESPRWHLLSWVLDWHTLEERCLSLKANPELKNPGQELKYLVIDYTQFDEWSSDEEITASAGIEKGYEDWDVEVGEDKISEHGLSGDEANLEFNVVQKFEGDDGGEFDEDEILPDQVIFLYSLFLLFFNNVVADLALSFNAKWIVFEIAIDFNLQCNLFSLQYCFKFA